MSDVILPEDIGRPAMVEKVAEGVRRAMRDAGIDDPADVHYVQTKTPLLTMETIAEAKARGATVFTEQTLESMDISNGTSGLGIAVALGEIEVPTAGQIARDFSLYSSVASCSSDPHACTWFHGRWSPFRYRRWPPCIRGASLSERSRRHNWGSSA